jgi:SAM-dependent methyltransferase
MNTTLLPPAPPEGVLSADPGTLPASIESAGSEPAGVNYFNVPAAAARYAAHRPRGQSRVMALVAEMLRPDLPVARALDVGCGTGHSTVALLPHAQQIFGLDLSSVMLAQAAPHPRIAYRKGHAEALPFQLESFDLVTVSSAYHWFDHDRFLLEAARVLRPGGWLVLYKAASLGQAVNEPDFDRWRQEVLRGRYPRVARNHEVLTAAAAVAIGFSEVRCETTAFQQTHELADYVENLLTHSSVIRVVDGGREPIEEARAWLRSELAPFFPGGRAEFSHEVKIHVLRRNAPAA